MLYCNVANITTWSPCLTADSENRSICINELRNILSNLHTEDYVRFSDDILGTRCDVNGTLCEDKRLVLIDIIARMGDETSQDLLLRHVLSKEAAVGEELRRVFIHCVAMENPTEVRMTVSHRPVALCREIRVHVSGVKKALKEKHLLTTGLSSLKQS